MKSKTVIPTPEEDLGAEDLPDGWFSSTLGDIADVVAGGTPTASDETNFSDDGYPWITPADLSNFGSVYIQRGRRSLSEKGLQTSAAKMLPKGTVLMSSRAPIGYVAIAANPISTNQGFKNFICHEEVASEYLYYWIKYLNPYLEGMGSGSTFAEISGTRAKKIPIKYPPLSEQQRIVVRIEALLSHVNVARERLSRVPLIMKRFRQAVLAAAFSGELTKNWQSENELIDNKGQIEENLPEGWKLKKIGSIITPSKEKVEPMMFPNSIYLGLEHIESSTSKIIGHGIASDVKSTKTVFHAGDVLYGKLRPYLNKVCIPDFDGLCSTDILVFNQNRIINNYYLMQFLSTREVVEYANLKSKGISLPRVSFENLAEIPIVLPPLAEQYKIVRRVGMLFERADAFDQEVVAASRRCERLTHAVLGKAFSGKL